MVTNKPLTAQSERPAETDYHKDKIPAPIFGEGFDEEARKITRLTPFLELETWTPIEAALLVCGIEPPPDCHEMPKGGMSLGGVFIMGTDDPFHYAKRILQIWNSQPNPPAKVRPVDFIAWCKTKSINTDWLRDIEPIDHQPEPDKTDDKAGLEQTNLPVLKTRVRDRAELTSLIYDFLKSKGINEGDPRRISAVDAWGLIVAGKFKSSYIETDGCNKVTLNGGKTVYQKGFAKSYNDKFK